MFKVCFFFIVFKYYGYVLLDGRPVESTIKFYINDVLIPQDSSNGWELIKEDGSPKYLNDFNVLITSPTDRTPGNPTENQTGYFLKVNGDAIYSNGDTVRWDFEPSAN